jgi:hypothetical protein
MGEQRRADGGELHALWRPFHELRLRRLLEATQAHAQGRLAQREGLRRASEVAVLRDHCEVFDVAEVHRHKRY